MDIWLEEWLDHHSARLREQESRSAWWKNRVTGLLKARIWKGRN